MAEDPERDADDEESSDSPSSGSKSSDDASDVPTSESDPPGDESDSPTSDPDSPADESDSPTSDPDPPADESDSPADDSDSPADEEPTDEASPATATDGTDRKGGSPLSRNDRGRADEDDDPSGAEERDADDEEYVEEFVVPGMESEPEPGELDDQEVPDVELIDDEDVAEDDELEKAATGEAEPTLPENQDGVGVDVPQQPLPEDDDGFFGGGPESDEEMPLAAHIEEMMRRLSVVFLVAGIVALTLLGLGQVYEPLPTAVELIDALWNNAIPGAPELADRRPRLYGPLELILTKLKVTGLAGLLIGLPVFVYETYLFMRPGLYRNERRYYLAAVPTSLLLGTIGMAFAHYIIIPAIMDYFTVYTQENVASVAYGLAETFNLILVLMGYMAVVFQIPLFIMLAIMMGLTTRTWLEDKRLLFWGGFLTVAFIINPDPTGMTPFIIAATMITLYEGTLALLRWTGN